MGTDGDAQLDHDHVNSANLPALNAPVLLEIQTIMVHNVSAKSMWDGGSSDQPQLCREG